MTSNHPKSSSVPKVIFCVELLTLCQGVFGSWSISQLYLTTLLYSKQQCGKDSVSGVKKLALMPNGLTLNKSLKLAASQFSVYKMGIIGPAPNHDLVLVRIK